MNYVLFEVCDKVRVRTNFVDRQQVEQHETGPTATLEKRYSRCPTNYT